MATKKATPATEKTTVKKAAAPKSTTTTKTTTKKAVTEADIRAKAEEIYNARVASGEPGDHESDWLNAEKALTLVKKRG